VHPAASAAALLASLLVGATPPLSLAAVAVTGLPLVTLGRCLVEEVAQLGKQLWALDAEPLATLLPNSVLEASLRGMIPREAAGTGIWEDGAAEVAGWLLPSCAMKICTAWDSNGSTSPLLA